MAKLIFERAVHRDIETGQLVSYWPDHWPLDLLATECIAVGTPFFAASYQNDPSALEGNQLRVDWIHFYTETELELARLVANVKRGLIYCGVDPSAGGAGSDPDSLGLFALEIIGDRGYALASLATRQSVDLQPQFIESWLDLYQPDLVILEEVSAQGFVGTALRTQIRDGRGSKWPIETRSPQGARDKGGKTRRLLAMAARWESTQVRVPGVMNSDGSMVVDPRWEQFVQQWRSYPVGHDDMLDAAYWACYEAFAEVTAGAVMLGAEHKTSEQMRKGDVEPATDQRGRVLQPIGTRRPRRGVRWRTGMEGNDPYGR